MDEEVRNMGDFQVARKIARGNGQKRALSEESRDGKACGVHLRRAHWQAVGSVVQDLRKEG